MELEELNKILRGAGIVGCGGAGFPSYAKLNKSADTIILNCAECEPLLKLHRQVMEKKAYEIMTALEDVAKVIDVKNIIIGIKPSYTQAVESIKANLSSFEHIKIGFLPEVYPAGDEVVLIYETTGRVVPPGSIPIAVGCVVFNVETMLNAYNAIHLNKPVTEKYVTICGEVKEPKTVLVPFGITFDELVELGGGKTREDVVYINGGPMMGRIVSGKDVVTKTTSSVLVLPENSFAVSHHRPNIKLQFNRAKAVCCDCEMCTSLCPRNLLGHPISPAAFMTAGVSLQTSNVKPFINTLYCCACGVCEMYACPQGLLPRTLIQEYKSGLRRNGVAMASPAEKTPVLVQRPHRMLDKERLTARLGLKPYDVPATLVDTKYEFKSLKLLLSQHVGVPCEPLVKVGDIVKKDDLIAASPEKSLGVSLHAPMDGTVAEVADKYIIIKA